MGRTADLHTYIYMRTVRFHLHESVIKYEDVSIPRRSAERNLLFLGEAI